jgi:hypothetical protein
MSRAGESVTRLDIRFPNEMYHKLQQIAVKDGARTHHISQKVEVSPTVIKLVQFALDTIAERLSDSSDNISDSLSGITTNSLPDKIDDVSDISDTRIEAIVDRRLAELGLFPDRQIESDSTPQFLPDKSDAVPDTLSDKDVILSDMVTLIPGSISDTENIPSDDSSNSESIAEDMQIIQTEAFEQVSGEIPQSFSFAEFHDWLGIPKPTKRNKANGAIAIATAKEKGLGDWKMDSSSFRFTKTTGD